MSTPSIPEQVAKACAVVGGQSALARLINASPAQVWQWVRGIRPVPSEYGAPIETATDRAVMRWDLRPDDWHLIWPELKRAKGAPPVPTAETEAGHA